MRYIDVINAGCYGYSSLQGLRLFRHRLQGLEPDVVTVYFGWNDHYLTKGYPDKMLQSTTERTPLLTRMFRPLRLYQFLRRGIEAIRSSRIEGQRSQRRLLRVSTEDYTRNLEQIVRLARGRGAEPILLTAPSNHTAETVPEEFISMNLAVSGEELVRLHQQYNDIVRSVAKDLDVHLLDLAEFFNQQDKAPLFLVDGVHFTSRGHLMIATALVDKLLSVGILTEAEANRFARSQPDSRTPGLLRSDVMFLEQPVRAEAGEPVPLRLRVTNTGDTIWRAEIPGFRGQVDIGVTIRGGDVYREYLADHVPRGNLPRDVAPGESVDVEWLIGPFDPGEFSLDVDLVSASIAWFDDVGDERHAGRMIIEPRR